MTAPDNAHKPQNDERRVEEEAPPEDKEVDRRKEIDFRVGRQEPLTECAEQVGTENEAERDKRSGAVVQFHREKRRGTLRHPGEGERGALLDEVRRLGARGGFPDQLRGDLFSLGFGPVFAACVRGFDCLHETHHPCCVVGIAEFFQFAFREQSHSSDASKEIRFRTVRA